MKPIVSPFPLRDPYTNEIIANVWSVGVKWDNQAGEQRGAMVMFSDKPNDDEVHRAVGLMREAHTDEGFPA